MYFQPARPYHVYNCGNNRQTIFFTPDNYLYFLRKIKQEWLPFCDILAWCLMPNHFHFLLVPNQSGCMPIQESNHLQLHKVIGKTLSSYTRAINKCYDRTGNLFQQKTKAKCLYQEGKPIATGNYLLHCLHYIHYNPVAAELATDFRKYIYSSAPDYYGKRNGSLCNKALLYQLGGYTEGDFSRSNKESELHWSGHSQTVATKRTLIKWPGQWPVDS